MTGSKPIPAAPERELVATQVCKANAELDKKFADVRGASAADYSKQIEDAGLEIRRPIPA